MWLSHWRPVPASLSAGPAPAIQARLARRYGVPYGQLELCAGARRGFPPYTDGRATPQTAEKLAWRERNDPPCTSGGACCVHVGPASSAYERHRVASRCTCGRRFDLLPMHHLPIQ